MHRFTKVALTAAMAGSLLLATTGAAHADAQSTTFQTLAEQAKSQVVTDVTPALTIPLAVASTSSPGSSCSLEWEYYADYSHQRGDGDTFETGYNKLSGHCDGLQRAEVTFLLADKGVPFFSSTYQGTDKDSTTSPYAYIKASGAQNVPLLTFPYDYHAFGSVITWSFHLSLTYKPGWTGPTDECAGAAAIWPASPSYAPCA